MSPQICADVAAPPSKYPRFWGSKQQVLSKYYRKRTPLAFDYTRPYMPPRCYFHSDIPPGPSNTKKGALKIHQGGRRGRDRPRRAIAPFFSVHWRKLYETCDCRVWLVSSSIWYAFGRATCPWFFEIDFWTLKIGGILRGAPPHLHKSEATAIDNTPHIS